LEWAAWFKRIPTNRKDFVKVWKMQLPRELPPLEDPLVVDFNFGNSFLEHFSPITNRDYTASQRNAEVSQLLDRVAVTSEVPAMAALEKGAGVIIRGNPWDAENLPAGVTHHDSDLAFTFARVSKSVPETTDIDAEIEVVWHKCLRGDPRTAWHAIKSAGGKNWAASTPRLGIVLARVGLNASKKLESGVCHVRSFKLCYLKCLIILLVLLFLLGHLRINYDS
jgi:hypothetical protein